MARLIDRNLTPNFIAFCATAPGVRRNFLAVTVPDNFAFANARRFFTSSLDHALINRRFDFAINDPHRIKAQIIPARMRI